jgi:hypothetical protein
MKLRREITIRPAYDKRDPNPNKNYGIGACRLFFSVTGPKGAITINFGTNWYLQSTIKEYKDKFKMDLYSTEPIKAWSWDYHSKKRMFKGQHSINKCEYTKGKCYCDGSYLNSDRYLPILLEKGSEGIFLELEKDYQDRFGVKKK